MADVRAAAGWCVFGQYRAIESFAGGQHSDVLCLTDLIDRDRGRGVCDDIRRELDDDCLVVNTFTVYSCHPVNA